MFTRRRKWRVPAGQEPTALDKKVMAMEAKGALVPKRSLIRTPEEIEFLGIVSGVGFARR